MIQGRDVLMAVDFGSEYTRVLMAEAGVLEAGSYDPWTGKPVVAHGVIVDGDAAGRLLERMAASAGQPLSAVRNVLVSCPLHLDCAAVRLRQALRVAGAPGVEIIRSTAAAAAGAGVDVSSRLAEMLVDVGAGLTEVAVFRDGDILHERTIPIGTRDLLTEPARNLSGREERGVAPATLADRVASMWRALPEPVQVEVMESGLVVTGGGAQSAELISALKDATRLTLRVAETPGQAVIRGLARLKRSVRAA